MTPSNSCGYDKVAEDCEVIVSEQPTLTRLREKCLLFLNESNDFFKAADALKALKINHEY